MKNATQKIVLHTYTRYLYSNDPSSLRRLYSSEEITIIAEVVSPKVLHIVNFLIDFRGDSQYDTVISTCNNYLTQILINKNTGLANNSNQQLTVLRNPKFKKSFNNYFKYQSNKFPKL